jgi:TonB family protein
LNRGRGVKKRVRQDHGFFVALLISLVIHVVVLAAFHGGGMREKSVRHYREVSPTLLVTTAEFLPEMPIRENEGPSPRKREEKTEGRSKRDASEDSPLSEDRAPLSGALPRNAPKPEIPKSEVPKQGNESGASPPLVENSSPAMPTNEHDGSEGRRGNEPQSSAVVESFDTGSGVRSTAFYDMGDLRDEIERQLRLYIEAHKRYPSPARRRGLDGEVELLLTMTGGKRVELGSTMLIRSAGNTLLDREARRLVESFFPYETEGDQWREIGKELSTTVKISYRLH